MAASALVVAALTGQAIWFGEITRMERAALYLRTLENKIDEAGLKLGEKPALEFEHFRGVKPVGGEQWVPKSASLVAGAFAMYSAMAVLGLVMLLDVARYAPHVNHALSALATVDASVLAVAWLGSSAWMARQSVKIFKSSSLPARN